MLRTPIRSHVAAPVAGWRGRMPVVEVVSVASFQAVSGLQSERPHGSPLRCPAVFGFARLTAEAVKRTPTGRRGTGKTLLVLPSGLSISTQSFQTLGARTRVTNLSE